MNKNIPNLVLSNAFFKILVFLVLWMDVSFGEKYLSDIARIMIFISQSPLDFHPKILSTKPLKIWKYFEISRNTK